jgi:membrane protease subunit (stomatin/prohibitin family)
MADLINQRGVEMSNKAKLLKLDEAIQTLLKNQIEQLGMYGIEYGY